MASAEEYKTILVIKYEYQGCLYTRDVNTKGEIQWLDEKSCVVYNELSQRLESLYKDKNSELVRKECPLKVKKTTSDKIIY